jgi:hypothetical protein
MLQLVAKTVGDALDRGRRDWTLVYGDTNSTLGSAAAAAAAAVPVAHVEAGLRSDDWSMLEERNRVKVNRIATPPPLPGRVRRRRSSGSARPGVPRPLPHLRLADGERW